MPRAFVETARRVKDGTFDGKPLRYGLASGVISFVWNPAVGDRPAARARRAEGREEKISSGTLVVPRGNF